MNAAQIAIIAATFTPSCRCIRCRAGDFQAARWFALLDDAVADGPHVAYILLRKAQIHDARNESEKAREYYARFLDLWDNPDPELRPIADQARSRLAALQGRTG